MILFSIFSRDAGTPSNSHHHDRESQDKNKLFELIIYYQWLLAATLLREKPALARDKFGGMNPLHYTLKKYVSDPPLQFVRDLIHTYPDAAKEQDVVGNLPLHYACDAMVSKEILRAVIRAYPEAATVQNFKGEVPLHLCDRMFNAKEIAELCPESISITDNKGNSPMFPFCYICITAVRPNPLAVNDIVNCDTVFIREENPLSAISLLEITRTLETLVTATAHRTLPAVHAALRHTGCPLRLCAILIFMYPQQACIVDAFGNYPLHLAAKLMRRHAWSERVKTNARYGVELNSTCRRRHGRYEDFVEYIVAVLTTFFPEAARKQDAAGLLPIELLSSAGASWKSGVSPVLNAYPGAIHDLDIDNRLMPRMLSKVGRDCRLSTMYEIVRGMPDEFKFAKAPRRSTRKRRRA